MAEQGGCFARMLRLLGIGALGTFLLMCLVYFGDSSGPAPRPEQTQAPEPKEPTETDLIHYARYIVRESLKSPSSAEFPLPESGAYSVGLLDDGRYQVTGYVEADNAFGAHLRQNFMVRLKLSGDQAYGQFVQIGDQVVIDVEK